MGETKKKIRPAFSLLEGRYGGVSQERVKYIVGKLNQKPERMFLVCAWFVFGGSWIPGQVTLDGTMCRIHRDLLCYETHACQT